MEPILENNAFSVLNNILNPNISFSSAKTAPSCGETHNNGQINNTSEEIYNCTLEEEAKENEEKGFWSNICDFFSNPFKYPKTKIKIEENKDSIKVTKTTKTSPFSYFAVSRSCKTYKDEEYDINGKLDMVVEQGNMEDCGLIATCYSLSLNPKGEKILKDAISINHNNKGNIESYSVYFKGIDETYTVTKEELDEAYGKTLELMTEKSEYSYSRGDKDMLLLECAWSKCVSQSEKLNNIPTNNVIHPVNGKYPDGLSNTDQAKLFYALTGEEFVESIYNDKELKNYRENSNNSKRKLAEEYLKSNSEFKITDIIDNIPETASLTSYDSNHNIKYHITANETYEIIGYSEDKKNITIKNKTTDENMTMRTEELISFISNINTQDDNEYIFNYGYEKAKNSDVRVLCTGGAGSAMLNDVDGNEIYMYKAHAYSVKSMNDSTITLVNPHDTSEEIVISKEELKNKMIKVSFNFGNLQ